MRLRIWLSDTLWPERWYREDKSPEKGFSTEPRGNFLAEQKRELQRLLHTLKLTVRTHERIEEGQHVTPVIDHAGENIAELRVAF